MNSPELKYLPIGSLFPSPTNPRKHYNEEALKELADSIRAQGVQMPLLVRESKEEPGRYEIVAGERRWRATGILLAELTAETLLFEEQGATDEDPQFAELKKLVKLRSVLRVMVYDYTAAQVLEIQLVENLQRAGLSPLEEASGYARLIAMGYTPAQVAEKVGKSVRVITRRVKILDAPDVAKNHLENGELTERHLLLLTSVPSKKQRDEALKIIMAGEYDMELAATRPLTTRRTEAMIAAKFRRTLAGVPFALDDATLLEAAGPCSTCPYFLAHAATMDPDLAEEVADGRPSERLGESMPLTCLKPSCLEKKLAAHVERVKAESAANGGHGQRVLTPREVAAMFEDGGKLKPGARFVNLAAKPGYEHTGHYAESKTPEWREFLADQLTPEEIVIANVPGVGVVELVDAEVALERGRKHAEHGAQLALDGRQRGKQQESEEDLQAVEEAKRAKLVKERVKHVTLSFLYDAVMTSHDTEGQAAAVLEMALYECGVDGCKFLCEHLDLKAASASHEHYRAALLQSVDGAGKRNVDAMIMLAICARWVKAYGSEVALLEPLKKFFGFDDKTILALAKAEVKADVAAKKRKKKKGGEDTAPVHRDSSNPVDFSVDAEAEKTAAADALDRESRAVYQAVLEGSGKTALAEHVLAVTAESAGFDLQAAIARHAKGVGIVELIGSKPNAKTHAAEYKAWNSLRMRILRGVEKLRVDKAQ